KLLYTRSDLRSGPERSIVLYDSDTGKSQDLVRGLVRQPHWSPDDTRITFLKAQDQAWQVWSFPIAAPGTATVFSEQPVSALHGWTDNHTVLASDLENAYWLGEDKPKQTIALREVYGLTFQIKGSDTLRLHPLNPDLLLVSANYATAPKDVPALGAGFF